jgi:hypothetical protein
MIAVVVFKSRNDEISILSVCIIREEQRKEM